MMPGEHSPCCVWTRRDVWNRERLAVPRALVSSVPVGCGAGAVPAVLIIWGDESLADVAIVDGALTGGRALSCASEGAEMLGLVCVAGTEFSAILPAKASAMVMFKSGG
eukprot:2240224-Pleurochrysis_carterae.AAC.1